MQLIALSTFAIAASLLCSPVRSESLDEYLAALESEFRTAPQSPPASKPLSQRPSLDSKRLLRQSQAIIHAARPNQRERLQNVLIGFVPRYVVPASVSPIPQPGEYLAFTEVHVIYSEILNRGTYLQLANWAGSDTELLNSALQSLCSAPSTTDFQRRVLDREIAEGRYAANAIEQARALSARLVQRIAWYTSGENLSTCRDLARLRVAP
jgi:hypothetical protein